MRCSWTRLFFVSLLTALVACGGGDSSEQGDGERAERRADNAPRPHVILISLDTTRPDHLGAYGNPDARTPTLDALARESAVFVDMTTAAPTTLASHMSIFTGTHPHTHGTARNGFVVNPKNLTLAEVLSDAGYRTAGFVASFALDRRFGCDQGFEHWDQDFDRRDGDGDYDQDQRTAGAVTDSVLRYLDGGDVDRATDPRPMFLFVHYFDPHLPYEPPWPDRELCGDPSPGEPIDVAAVRNQSTLQPGISFPEAERLAARYAGEIRYMDRELGRLIDGLRERSILDDAIVVVVSDHGENHHEHHDTFDHGHTLYQTAVRVVGMIRKGEGFRNADASTVDWYPTILKLAGVPAPHGSRPIEGLAYNSVMEGLVELGYYPGRARSEATKPWQDYEVEGKWTNAYKSRMIRGFAYKYIFTPYRRTEELYALDSDPGETRNLLAGERSAEIEKVRKELREALDSWAGSADPFESRFDDSQQRETIERLKRLGYLERREE